MKTILIGIITLMLVTLVNAECEYNVGDTVTLPSITTNVLPDTDRSDGNLRYIYCSYGLRDKSIVGFEPYNTQCPSTEMSTELNVGTIDWTTVITSIDVIYNNGWIPEAPLLLEQVETSYDACYPAPDESFIQSLIETIMTFICKLFDFGFCTFSPESSIDCAWCDNECVEWQLLEDYTTCDRTPVDGKSCVMVTISDRNFCAPITTVPEGDLLTFCSEEEFLQMVTDYNGDFESLDIYLREHCDGLYFPLDFCPTEYSSDELLDSNYNFIGHDMECRSVCTDVNGTIRGGHIVWNLRYNFDTQQGITSNPVSVIPYPTEECI